MNRRRIYTNVIVFTLGFLVMVAWAVSQVVSIDLKDNPYRLRAEFANAFGIGPNAEVTYLGVPIGSIEKVERKESIAGVEITMKIQKGREVPDGSIANVGRKSAIGEPFVDFAPPTGYAGNGGPFYKAGTLIKADHTTIPLEFSELLRSASALVASIPPDALGNVLHEAAIGLQGNTDALRQLADAGDKLSATFAERTAVLDRLATNSTRITQILADHRGSLDQSLRDLRALATTLKDARGDTNLLLDRGTALVGQVADIVANQKGNLDCDLKTLELVLDTTSNASRIKGLQLLLRSGPKAFAGVWDSRDIEPDGVWVRVGLITSTVNPVLAYVPAHDPPAVKTVSACASGLHAVGADYRPQSVPGIPGSLAATGWDGPLGAGAGLVAMAALVRLAVRRSRTQGPTSP